MLEKMMFKFKGLWRNIQNRITDNWKKGYKLPKKVKYFEGSLYDALYEAALKYPLNTAIQYGDNEISYKSLIKRINKCARALKYYGVSKGDKVTICMPNTPEEVIMFYAINEVGAVANMIHPLSSEKEIEYYLNKSDSKIMLCIDVAYKKIESIINNTKLEKVIITSATKSMEKLTALMYWILKGRKLGVRENEKFILWDHFIKMANEYTDDPYVSVDSMDPAVILYSGGTTGKSKGVLISNYSFNVEALQCRYVFPDFKPGESILTFLPNFHAFGIGICTHVPLYSGVKVILIPQFDAKKLKSYIRKYHFSILCGVPTLYDYLTKINFKKNDLKCIKIAVSGGDAMSLTLKKRVNEFLKEHGSSSEMQIGYGLTESSGVVAICPKGIYDEADVIGYPFPDVKFKIINIFTGEETKIGETGEICISGPNVMMEYLNDKKETEGVLTKQKDRIWLHSGDIGFKDKKGLIHYKTRLKRMIITSGYNVYPANVEEVILMHENVDSCAVIGVPNANKGEIVKAYVVLKNKANPVITKLGIQKLLKKHLAKYEQPREIDFIDELPKTKLGKIAYKELEGLNEKNV